jgi:hypothetical protein
MKNIYQALSEFQNEVPVILKDTAGHNYKYADLPQIISTINPILKEKKLGYYQALNGSKIKTVIFHCESGESIESETDVPFDSLVYEEATKTFNGVSTKVMVIKGFEGMNRAQAIGSLITYFRRYSLSTILGLVTDTDTDGTAPARPKLRVAATGDAVTKTCPICQTVHTGKYDKCLDCWKKGQAELPGAPSPTQRANHQAKLDTSEPTEDEINQIFSKR